MGLKDGTEEKRGDSERKKNVTKKGKDRLATEESKDGYGERAGNDTEKKTEIRGQKNHDGNAIEKVGRKNKNKKKKKKKKRENDKIRVSENQLRVRFENIEAGSTSKEGPDELQNGTDDVAVGEESDRIVVVTDHNKAVKLRKRPEGSLVLGAEQEDTSFLIKQGEGIEAFGEGHDLESVEKGEKRKKRKREKEKNIVSEGEVQRHDFDDPDSERQSTFVDRDHNELLKELNVKATAEGDVVKTDEKKRKKISKKTNSDSGSGADTIMNLGDAVKKDEKKRKKMSKKTKSDSGSGADTTTNLEFDSQLNNKTKGNTEAKSVDNGSKDPKPKKGKKKVSFSGKDEVFQLPEDNLVRGKRFSKEEDEMVKEAVLKYIEANSLGEEGIKMVLNCRSHPKIRDCWKEIVSALPHRPKSAVYFRAQNLFRRGEKRKWTKEEIEILRESHKKYGNQWNALADELGKHRVHVKDTWRRIRHENLKSGRWSQDEYQSLFDLVNLDLRMKYTEEKISRHGMLRDNVPWTAISDKLTTRSEATCCFKWYYQLTSPMVMEGDWVDSDDYRLIDALFQLDASCCEDVDWDNLLDHRSGAIAEKRWNEMVLHIGDNVKRSFADQVEVLAKRYCPELLEAREIWDNKPYVP